MVVGGLLGKLDVERDDVDEVDLVALLREPEGVAAGPAADVEDAGGRGREEAGEELARALAVKLAGAGLEAVGFVAGGVVAGD